MTIKKVSRNTVQCFPGGKNHLPLRTTVLEKERLSADAVASYGPSKDDLLYPEISPLEAVAHLPHFLLTPLPLTLAS